MFSIFVNDLEKRTEVTNCANVNVATKDCEVVDVFMIPKD